MTTRVNSVDTADAATTDESSSQEPLTTTSMTDEERLSLDVWASLVFNPHFSSQSAAVSRQRSGPRVPPGWFPDINDRVLLTYDPYFRSFEGPQSDAAAPVFVEKDGRYYADRALPLCLTSAHSRRSTPPAGVAELRESGRRYVVAQRSVRAGEIVCMDTSLVSVVSNPRVFLYPPPDPILANETAEAKHALSVCSHSGALLARDFIKKVGCLAGGPALLKSTCYAQFIATLLVLYGDDEILRRTTNVSKTESEGGAKGTGAQRFHECDALVRELLQRPWSGVCAAEMPSQLEVTKIASFLLLCMPPRLLYTSNKAEDGTVACGFIARLGLHIPATLARVLAVVDQDMTNIQIPDLSTRSALFPFFRGFQHECRPSCGVFFLDSPASHCYGDAAEFNYDTQASKASMQQRLQRLGELFSGGSGRQSEALKSMMAKKQQQQQSQLPPVWGDVCSTRIFLPSVAVVVAMRDIQVGEELSIGYIPSTYMTQPQRSKALLERFHFACKCRWCTREPDLARAFRCPTCPRHMGVICPAGDGSRMDEWICLQCGFHPSEQEITRCLDEEVRLRSIKADKASGLSNLLSSEYVHYTHAIVYNKMDEWSERAWRLQDGELCMSCLEAMQKCIHRVLDPCDPNKGQLHEFMGQVNHALGNAHSARYEYFLALQLRLRAGTRYAHWTRKTRFMAAEKTLADFLDSK